MTNELFLEQFRMWIAEMRQVATERPGIGAYTLASGMELWLWTLEYLQKAKDAEGAALYHGQRQGVTFALADALCWLLASRCQILDVLELEAKGPENPVVAEGLAGYVNFFSDLCAVQAARAAGEVGRICAELVYGYNRPPALDSGKMGTVPRERSDRVDCSHLPGTAFEGADQFAQLRLKLDGCLTGARLAKDRAAHALTQVMIPEAMDYPV